MPDYRVFKQNMVEDERFGTLPLFAQHLFMMLCLLADDQGRLIGHPAFIRSRAFPYQDVPVSDVSDGLAALSEAGLILHYQADGRALIQILTWWADQSRMQWASPSEYPAPDGWEDRVRYRRGNQVISHNWAARPAPASAPPSSDAPPGPGGTTEESASDSLPEAPCDPDAPSLAGTPAPVASTAATSAPDVDSPQLDPSPKALGNGSGNALPKALGNALPKALGNALGNGLGKATIKTRIKNKTRTENQTPTRPPPCQGGGGVGEGDDTQAAGGRRAGGREKSPLCRLLELAGFRARDRTALLARLDAGELTPEDVFSELARAYADRRVRRPPLAAAKQLLDGNLPPPEFREPDAWRDHLPGKLLRAVEQAGLMPSETARRAPWSKYIQGPYAEFIETGISDNAGVSDPPDLGDEVAVRSADPPDMPVVEGETPPEEVVRWWTSAREQLRLDMPRFAFDQRVQPLRLLAYRNDGERGRFTLAAPDEFTRDWLDSRVKRTLERVLAGYACKHVEVEFVV